MHKIIFTKKAPSPIGPYSQAILAGDTLYVSGQIAIDPSSNQLIAGDVQDETRQIMKNIEAILHEAGATFRNVVKCSIFVSDMGDFALVNEIYGQSFEVNPPARETVEVSALPKNVKVEISCIAVI